jgi:hypothetical protein
MTTSAIIITVTIAGGEYGRHTASCAEARHLLGLPAA